MTNYLAKNYLAIFLLLFLTACLAPDTAPPTIHDDDVKAEEDAQAELYVTDFRTHERRMLNVWWRVAKANLDLCPKDDIAPSYGFRLAGRKTIDTPALFKNYDRRRYSFTTGGGWIKVYDRVYGSGKGWLTVGQVYEGTAAEVAGLQPKDRIVAIDSKGYGNSNQERRKLYRYLFDVGAKGQNIKLRVSRGSVEQARELDIIIAPLPVCFFPTYLKASGQKDAFTDGERIYFTTAMMNFLRTDEELALIIGHEMAHGSEKHVDKQVGREIIGGVIDSLLAVYGGISTGAYFTNSASHAYAQDEETEADYVGLYMMARAGYNIDGAANIWRRMAIDSPTAIQDDWRSSHPSSPKRFLVLEETIKEIKRKRKYGLPLYPELK